MTGALPPVWASMFERLNGRPGLFGEAGVRDPDHTCEDFTATGYDGTGRCSSDGHYMCTECHHLAPDAPRFENDGGRGDRLRLFWRRPRAVATPSGSEENGR